VDPSLPELRLAVPCNDALDFDARLADAIAANGVRIPTERGLAVSTRVGVALVFRDGTTFRTEGVVDEHLTIEDRSAVHVRLPALERPAPTPRTRRGPPCGDEPLGTPPGRLAAVDADEPLWAASGDARAEPAAADDPPEVSAILVSEPRELGGAFETSGDVLAAVRRGGDRAQRLALALAAAALVIAVAGYALVRRVGPDASPKAAVSAHLDASERLEAEGRLAGDDGAIAELLAARKLDPANEDVPARLARIADRLERLGAQALRRNDLAAARIDLETAQLAAPGRASIRAKLDELEKRKRRAEARKRRAAPGKTARR
jgi:hypothetical protein